MNKLQAPDTITTAPAPGMGFDVRCSRYFECVRKGYDVLPVCDIPAKVGEMRLEPSTAIEAGRSLLRQTVLMPEEPPRDEMVHIS